MKKIFDIFIGRIDGCHTYRTAHFVTQQELDVWLAKGYRIETEHQIGTVLHEVYLIKA